MIYLLLSIFCSVVTVSFFKVFEKYGVNTFQAIVGNYVSCVLVGNYFLEKPILFTAFYLQPWFVYTCILGVLFISVFYYIALTAQRIGVSVSMVAAKLSVVIPVLLAVFFHHEQISWIKSLGILLSLVSVYFISVKDQAIQQVKYWWLLPLIVFAGSGAIDSLLHFIELNFIPPADAGDIISTIFLVALFIGASVILVNSFIAGKEQVQLKNLIWGLALGVPNYFSMYFLLKTLGAFKAGIIFPVNNTSIVAVSTLVSILFFKERMSTKNSIGMFLAIVSILLVSFL
jgi:drug/metabolite transporter (DMT)-like permease